MAAFIDFLLFWVFAAATLPSPLGALCPDGCVCSERSVVCSCAELWSPNASPNATELRLSPFSGQIDFTNLLIIHSCDRVIIPNDTFVGVDIVEQLKFLGVGHLEIHSHAFRQIRTSPRQIVIQDSHVATLPAYAFDGLAHLDHFWFRNVTIGRIGRMAFARLRDVRYIYFRDAAIGQIDSGAFAHMREINYFFIRERVLIKSMGDFVFLGSEMEELIFEKAHVHATDLTLMGIHSERILIAETKWNSKRVAAIKRIPPQRVHELHIRNVTMNRLVPSLFYNHTRILIEHSTILHIQPAPNLSLQNISTFSFVHSTLTNWHPHSFSAARGVDRIEFLYSAIESIHHHAIFASELGAVELRNVHISLLSARAFERNDIHEFTIGHSTIQTAGKAMFGQSAIQNLTIERVRVQNPEAGIFALMNSSLFTLRDSHFGYFPSLMFRDSFIDDLSIRFCTFEQNPPTNDAFRRLHANRLLFTESAFECDPNDCETNALFLSKSIHPLAWSFTNNRCSNEETELCVKETESNRSGVVCRRRMEIEECVCTEDAAEVVFVLDSNATIVVLGDCHRLQLKKGDSTSLQILYLYRISSLEIQSVVPTLSQIHLLHSHVHFPQPYSFGALYLHQINIVGSYVDHIAPLTFAAATIDYLYLNGSTMRAIASNAFAHSHIHSVDLWQTNIISAGNLFEHSRELRAENSVLHDVRFLENITQICLKNNSVNCRCLFGPTVGSVCADPLTQCIEMPTRGPEEPTIHPFDCHDSLQRLGSSYSNAPQSSSSVPLISVLYQTVLICLFYGFLILI